MIAPMARRPPRSPNASGWKTVASRPKARPTADAPATAPDAPMPSSTPQEDGPREVEPHLLVGLFSLVVQAVQYWWLADDPSATGPIIDGREYHAEALRIVTGGVAPPVPHWQSPLFAWALAAAYRVGGPSPLTGLALQALLAVLLAQLVVALTRPLLGPRAALGAGVAAALYGPLLFFASQLIAAPLEAAAALAALWLALRTPAAKGATAHALLGVVLGVAVAARGTVAPFALFVGWRLWAARGSLGVRPMATRLGAFVTGLVAAQLPVALSNAQRYGRFVLSTANLGINLFVGNNEDVASTTALRPGWRWDDLTFEPARHGVFDPFAQSDFFVGRAASWSARHPLDFVATLATKLADTLHGAEIARNLDPYGSLGRTPLTQALLWDHGLRLPFGAVLPLAVVGFADLWRRRAEGDAWRGSWSVIAAFVGSNALGIALFFPSGRYRLGLALALFVPATAGVDALRRAWTKRSMARPVAALGATVLVLANLLPAFSGPDLRDEGPLQIAWAHLSAGRVRQAVTVLEAETLRRGDDSDLWRTLGEARDRAGDGDGAIAALTRAIEVAPRNAHAQHHLGALLFTRGRGADARTHLEAAVALWPAHPLAWADLAGACLDSGDPAAARTAADTSVARSPANGYGWYYRGLARVRTGDGPGAVDDLQHAATLLATAPDVRVALAEALDGAGRRAEAIEAARAAVRIAPRQPRARELLRSWQAER